MESLNSIYSKTYNFVYLRAKCIFEKEDDVQQLMKEVYTKVLEHDLPEERLYSWLGKQVYSIGCGKFRKKKVSESTRIELGDDEYYMSSTVNVEKTKELICETIEQLPDLYQATLYAFYHDHLRIKEIANLMGYGTKVIMYRLNYSHKYLKTVLQRHAQENWANVEFSVEAMCLALEQWSKDKVMPQTVAFNTLGTFCREMGIPLEATCEEDELAGADRQIVEYEDGYLNAVCDELMTYSEKEKSTGTVKWILAGAGVLALLAILIGLIVFCIKLKKDLGKDPEPTPPVVEQQEELEELPEDNVDLAEYVLPNSDTVKYTREELEDLSIEELRLARNELFARYGTYFGVSDLDEHFKSKSWYTPKMSVSEFYDSIEMNEVELANLRLIRQIEDQKAQ